LGRRGGGGKPDAGYRDSVAGGSASGAHAHAMEPAPPSQRTGLVILALVLSVVPVLGLVVARVAKSRTQEGTTGYRCAIIAFRVSEVSLLLSMLVAVIGVLFFGWKLGPTTDTVGSPIGGS
jgi:hypothetical protein